MRGALAAAGLAAMAVLGLAVAAVSAPAGSELASPPASEPASEAARARPGGAVTVEDRTSKAFAQPAPNLPVRRLRDFAFGNRLFNTNWVTAPASVASLDGLGPVFNRVSCSACHTRDGRGAPPAGPDEPMDSMLVRLSIPGADDDGGGPKPHPVYGDQLNDRAIHGVPAEGRASVRWETVEGTYADGTPYTLRRPVLAFRDLAFGPLGENVMTSPRVAPPVHGLGLIEAVPEADILARADPDDADGDGISGRPNRVWDVAEQRVALGRFGWKANQPSLRQQAAGAALGDMGITTSLFPEQNVMPGQADAAAAASGGRPEMSDPQLEKLVFYLRTLAVPAPRNLDDPAVRRGEALFEQMSCAACHTPSMTTGEHPLAQLADQRIYPYTDLLLHDMGPGLADGRPDFEATGRAWRTPPLWGIGLTETVNGHTFFLHDGRARNLEEAILWHGGEAEAAREAFRTLPAADRAALVAFLKSL